MKKLISVVLSLGLLFSVASSGYCLPSEKEKPAVIQYIEDFGNQASNIVKATLASATALVLGRIVLGYAVGPFGYIVASLGIFTFGGESIATTIKTLRA